MSWLQTARYAVRTSQFDQIARWPPRRIEWLARWRLRRLLRYAVQHSAFYREKYRGFDVRRVALADLPTTTKAEMAARFDDVVTDPALRLEKLTQFMERPENLGQWYQGRYAVSHTSGSQGQPLVIVQNRNCLEVLFALTSSRANAGPRPTLIEGLRRLRHPARVAVVAVRRAFYPSGAAFEFLSQLSGRFIATRWFNSAQPDLVERLNEYQPQVLVAYASVLEALAMNEGGLDLRELHQVANSSEQLTLRARARIAAKWGVPIIDHYGTGECLHLADGCPQRSGAHVNADWAILEVVDEENRPVPDGPLGKKVLVTNLVNCVQPFIRYEVGDQLAMAVEACGCGNRLPRIERIEGRAAELFWVGPEHAPQMISGAQFHTALDATGAIREWQAVQRERNRVELRLNLLHAAELAPELRDQILRQLNEFGLPPVLQIDLQVVSPLQPDPRTGKLRRMVNELPKPA